MVLQKVNQVKLQKRMESCNKISDLNELTGKSKN